LREDEKGMSGESLRVITDFAVSTIRVVGGEGASSSCPQPSSTVSRVSAE
jgi:hypothetical protein